VIGKGRLIADCSVAEFIAGNSVQTVRVRTPEPAALMAAASQAGGTAVAGDDGALVVQGLTAERIGDLAFDQGIRLHELAPAQASLEEAFMGLTAGSVEFRAGVPASAGRGDGTPAGPGKGA